MLDYATAKFMLHLGSVGGHASMTDILLMVFLMASTTLTDGKCSACHKWGVKSRVTMDDSSWICTTATCSATKYDEAGRIIPPEPCNTCRQGGVCSNGHLVTHTLKVH